MPFEYPTSFELDQIEPELVGLAEAGRLGLEISPIRPVNAAKVRWTQEDNYYGLQQLRGMDGAPTHIGRVGAKTYEYEPGVFGEFDDITETELTIRAGSVTDVAATPIDVADLVMDAENRLLARERDRIEASIWDVLVDGIISITIAGPTGTQVGYRDSYTLQTFTAAIPWSTLATATPLRNFQSVQQLGQVAGHSVDFGAGAMACMNTVTANNLLNNLNANDLYGKRLNGGGTLNSITDIQGILTGQNLPKIRVYDGGYVNTKGGPFIKFIPDNKVVVIGRRTSGARIMNYIVTRNANAGYKPVSYRYIKDRANGVNAEKRTPPNIEIHRGHNGGPAIYFPSAIVVMSV